MTALFSHPPAASGYWRSLLFVLLCSAILTLPFLPTPFSTRGEPREALVAQSIFNEGNWILGRGYSGVVPSKPPLLHWLITVASAPFGTVTEVSARLPSALGSLIFAALFFAFVAKRRGVPRATLTVVVLVSTVEWARTAIACRVDLLLAVSLFAGLLALYRWYERDLKGVSVLAVTGIGVATLAKGPVALGLSGVIFVAFLLAQGVPWRKIIVSSLVTFVPAALVASLWYLLAYREGGREFFDRIVYENVLRLVGAQEDSPHQHSVFYLYGMLFAGLLPWSLSLLPAVLGAIKSTLSLSWWRSVPIPSSIAQKLRSAWCAFQKLPPLEQLFIIIAAVITLFFSLPEGKRSVYLLPAYPAFAYGLAALLERQALILTKWRGRIITGCALIPLALLLALFVIHRSAHGSLHQFAEAIVASPRAVTSLVLGVFLPLIFARWKEAVALPVLWIVLYASVGIAAYPTAGELMTPRYFAHAFRSHLTHDETLFSFRNEFYGLSFYLDSTIRRLDGVPELDGLSGVVFLYEKQVEALKTFLPPGTELSQIARSPNAIDKPNGYVVAFRFSVPPSLSGSP